MTYTKLSIVEFGDALLKTGDLDPIYIALGAARFTEPKLCKLLLAYWCFYDLGTATRLADVKDADYWDAMLVAASNEGFTSDGKKPWPRGAERRHFRGEQANLAMGELYKKYRLLGHGAVMTKFLGLHKSDRVTFKSVSKAVQTHRGFGDWIAFKCADMAERVLRIEVDFNDCELGIYKDPRQGAAVAFLEQTKACYTVDDVEQKPWDFPIRDDQLKSTVDYYVKLFCRKGHVALPWKDRFVNVQEIETIFCKYKSHLKGSYPPGKDTRELIHALDPLTNPSAMQIKESLPPLWLANKT
jgi:hypothetical protein